MCNDVKALLSALSQSPNDSAIAKSKRWLNENADGKATNEIISEIELRAGNAEDYLCNA